MNLVVELVFAFLTALSFFLCGSAAAVVHYQAGRDPERFRSVVNVTFFAGLGFLALLVWL